jgi:hypothetical protein
MLVGLLGGPESAAHKPMTYKLITDNQIRDLPVPEQYFQYADAYLRAAIRQCEFLAELPLRGPWPDATVALFLAAHAIELFLKAAILLREPGTDPATAGHDISKLTRKFRELFPEPEFDWEVPFSAEDADQDVPPTIKSERAMQSMVLRYPLNKKQVPWSQLSAMEPTTFKRDLLGWQEKFAQLQNRCRTS